MTKAQRIKALKAIGKGCTTTGYLSDGKDTCAIGSLLVAAGRPISTMHGRSSPYELEKHFLWQMYGIDCEDVSPIISTNDQTQGLKNRRKKIAKIINNIFRRPAK